METRLSLGNLSCPLTAHTQVEWGHARILVVQECPTPPPFLLWSEASLIGSERPRKPRRESAKGPASTRNMSGWNLLFCNLERKFRARAPRQRCECSHLTRHDAWQAGRQTGWTREMDGTPGMGPSPDPRGRETYSLSATCLRSGT